MPLSFRALPGGDNDGGAGVSEGTIVTSAPDVMWGTDGVRVFTAEDGWVWTFAAVDHWNAECVGWHVCKVGNRFAALEPIAQGLGRHYGSVEADVARGLAPTAHGTTPRYPRWARLAKRDASVQVQCRRPTR